MLDGSWRQGAAREEGRWREGGNVLDVNPSACVPPGVSVKISDTKSGISGRLVEGEAGRKRIRWSRAGAVMLVLGVSIPIVPSFCAIERCEMSIEREKCACYVNFDSLLRRSLMS